MKKPYQFRIGDTVKIIDIINKGFGNTVSYEKCRKNIGKVSVIECIDGSYDKEKPIIKLQNQFGIGIQYYFPKELKIIKKSKRSKWQNVWKGS